MLSLRRSLELKNVENPILTNLRRMSTNTDITCIFTRHGCSACEAIYKAQEEIETQKPHAVQWFDCDDEHVSDVLIKMDHTKLPAVVQFSNGVIQKMYSARNVKDGRDFWQKGISET